MEELWITDLGSLNFRHDWKLPLQIQECYNLKYLTTDTIRVQYAVSSGSIPPVVQLLNVDTDELVTLTPSQVAATPDYITYNVTISNLEAGCYVFQFYAGGTVIEWAAFSIHEKLENSILVEYTNYEDDFETVFAEDEPFYFRIEGVFPPQLAEFNSEANHFRDQRYASHLLSGYSYDIDTLFFGGQFGAPRYVASKINRIFSCSTVLIDGEEYVKADGANVTKEVLSPAYPLYTYTIQLEKKRQGSKVIPLEKSIILTTYVENTYLHIPVPGVDIIATAKMGRSYLIGTGITDSKGECIIKWKIDKEEYESLIAGYPQFEIQGFKEGYSQGGRVVTFPPYDIAIRDGIIGLPVYMSPILQPIPTEANFNALGGQIVIGVHGSYFESDLSCRLDIDWATAALVSRGTIVLTVDENLTSQKRTGTLFIMDSGAVTDSGGIYTFTAEVPITQTAQMPTFDKVSVGANMRGKMARFTNTDKMPTKLAINTILSLIAQGNETGERLYINYEGGDQYDSRTQIGTSSDGSWDIEIYSESLRWMEEVIIFPDDQDYIVLSNDLPTHAGSDWGFDYTEIHLPKPVDALTDIRVGYNLRGKTIEFTNTDKYVPKPESDDPEFTGFFINAGRSEEEPDYIVGCAYFGGETWAIVAASNEIGFDVVFQNTDSDQEWVKTSITVPDDRDYIVISNDLPIHAGDDWGFDYTKIK